MLEDLVGLLESEQQMPSQKTMLDAIPIGIFSSPTETPEEILKLKAALECISPDILRGDGSIDIKDPEGANWLGAIWAIASLDWVSGQGIAQQWSMKSDRYTEDGFEAAWKAYNPNHPNPIGIGSLYKLAEIQEFKSHGSSIFKEDQVASPTTNKQSPLGLLKRFSATGSSKDMRQKMLSDKFVMKDIAILGQWTTLYAAPNTGKTLLTLWLLREQILIGELDADKVFYINADDTYRGAVEKIEIAEQLGMEMLIPNSNEFKTKYVPKLMQKLAEDDEAKGVVIVLDTLKKFTDLMDKTAASEFGKTAREFISAGGTLICLAHTNKHTDSEGKGIYSGTSDIVDDSDCAYIIDKVSVIENPGFSLSTIEFSNKKARGDVASTASFTFTKTQGMPYSNLLDSVKTLNTSDLDEVKRQAERDKQLANDKDVIKSIRSQIINGTISKSEIIKSVAAETAEGPTKVRKVLDYWTGPDSSQGHQWTYAQGAHNKYEYALLTHPLKTN